MALLTAAEFSALKNNPSIQEHDPQKAVELRRQHQLEIINSLLTEAALSKSSETIMYAVTRWQDRDWLVAQLQTAGYEPAGGLGVGIYVIWIDTQTIKS